MVTVHYLVCSIAPRRHQTTHNMLLELLVVAKKPYTQQTQGRPRALEVCAYMPDAYHVLAGSRGWGRGQDGGHIRAAPLPQQGAVVDGGQHGGILTAINPTLPASERAKTRKGNPKSRLGT